MESRAKTAFGRRSSRRNEDNRNEYWNRPGTTIADFDGMQQRPTSVIARLQCESRPGTSILNRRPATTKRGTATARPPTARPETSGINVRIPKNEVNLLQIGNRPTTQHGVPGVPMQTPTTSYGNRRLVHDKSYFKGILNERLVEIANEIKQINDSVELIEKEQSSWGSFEKQAKELAAEMIKLEEELHDYNDINDLISSGNDKWDLVQELKHLKNEIQIQAAKIDSIFNNRKNLEQQTLNLELNLEQERGRANVIVQELPDDLRDQYESLMEETFHLQGEVEHYQLEYEHICRKTQESINAICITEIKRRAAQLEEEYLELCEKKDEILKKSLSIETPDQEKARLLTQFKVDDEEISKIGKQSEHNQKKIEQAKNELIKIEKEIQELEASQAKCAEENIELKKHENDITEFLTIFENKQRLTLEKLEALEAKNALLKKKSEKYAELTKALAGHEVTPEQLKNIKAELKSIEENGDDNNETHESLEDEAERLEETLKLMDEDILRYRNIEKVQAERNEEMLELQKALEYLDERSKVVSEIFKSAKDEHDGLETDLNPNEMQKQLKGLEEKWTSLEEYNYKLLESIENEYNADYSSSQKLAGEIITDINQVLQGKYDQDME